MEIEQQLYSQPYGETGRRRYELQEIVTRKRTPDVQINDPFYDEFDEDGAAKEDHFYDLPKDEINNLRRVIHKKQILSDSSQRQKDPISNHVDAEHNIQSCDKEEGDHESPENDQPFKKPDYCDDESIYVSIDGIPTVKESKINQVHSSSPISDIYDFSNGEIVESPVHLGTLKCSLSSSHNLKDNVATFNHEDVDGYVNTLRDLPGGTTHNVQSSINNLREVYNYAEKLRKASPRDQEEDHDISPPSSSSCTFGKKEAIKNPEGAIEDSSVHDYVIRDPYTSPGEEAVKEDSKVINIYEPPSPSKKHKPAKTSKHKVVTVVDQDYVNNLPSATDEVSAYTLRSSSKKKQCSSSDEDHDKVNIVEV